MEDAREEAEEVERAAAVEVAREVRQRELLGEARSASTSGDATTSGGAPLRRT